MPIEHQQPLQPIPQHRPDPKSEVNERGSLNVSGYVRVFDPNTQQTLVEVRE